MTGRSLFTAAAAAELKAEREARQTQQPIDVDHWIVVASAQAFDGGAPRAIARSRDGTRFAVLSQSLGDWRIKAGPWPFEKWTECAERVCCGDAKALTWPDAQLCLAAGVMVFLHGLDKAEPNTPPSDAERAGAAPSGASAPAEYPLGAPPAHAPPSFEPPRDPRCTIAGCGE